MKLKIKFGLLGAALLAASASAQAETITLKVEHFLGPQTIQHTTMLGEWCRNIERDSKGRLNCQLFRLDATRRKAATVI